MTNVYESIITGLTEAVEDAKSNEKKLPRHVVSILPSKRREVSAVTKKHGEVRKNDQLAMRNVQ